MAEVWPKFKAIGMENVGITPTFRQIYGLGNLGDILIDFVYQTYISSADMKFIAPPNADLRLSMVRAQNTSTTSYRGGVNDATKLLAANETITFVESGVESDKNLLAGSKTFNYIRTASNPNVVKHQFWYYFNTTLVDYARMGSWNVDSIDITDGYPFSYAEFSTSSTSYTTIIQAEYEYIIKIKKACFWLGFYASGGAYTVYVKCDISNDGIDWTTLFEESTYNVVEVAIKKIFYNTSFKFIRIQGRTTDANIPLVLRVRELHFWGERDG